MKQEDFIRAGERLVKDAKYASLMAKEYLVRSGDEKFGLLYSEFAKVYANVSDEYFTLMELLTEVLKKTKEKHE